MITERSIKCFLELVRTLNFTSAANNLYMTQQAVSKQIESLENDLGVSLFVRSHRSVTLTPEGESFFQLFQKFSVEFKECLAKNRANYRYKMNQLRIGHQNWTYLGNAPYRAFKKICLSVPEFSLVGEKHSPGTLIKLAAGGSLDLILLYKRLAENLDNFKYLELKEILITLMVAKNRVRDAEHTDFAAFSSDPLIIDADEYEIQKYSREHEDIQRYGLTPSEIIVRPNRESVYLSVVLGHGITIGSSISQIENRSIAQYPIGCSDKLICAWRKNASNPLVESFANILYEEFSSE